MPATTVAHDSRYRYIDSLRGLAAVSVIIYHILEFNAPTNEFEQFLRWLLFEKVDLGKVAVTVFFAISGYVIPYSLLKGQKRPLTNFLISRFFRLYPAYWLSIVCGILLLFVIPSNPLKVSVVLLNITMLQQFFGVENIIGVYWTLQIELIFYFLCAALFYLGYFNNHRIIFRIIWCLLAFAFLLAVCRYVSHKNLPIAIPLALSLMILGYIWRTMGNPETEHLRKPFRNAIIGYFVLMPAISYFGYTALTLQYVLTYYFSIAIFLTCTSRLKINFQPTAYLGRISYSLYLFGSLAMVIAMKILTGYNGSFKVTAIIALTLAISIPCCHAIYYSVEWPSISIGRWITTKIDNSTFDPHKSRSLNRPVS
jgi:peptidoglycan/LPS O-acetylase OafA/YrhL